MTLERYYQKFLYSNGEIEFRFVVLGEFTADLKLMIKKLTDEPNNTEMQRSIIRGSTHERSRPENKRFGQGSLTLSLTKRDMSADTGKYGADQMNWVGVTWCEEYNNKKHPSLNQI